MKNQRESAVMTTAVGSANYAAAVTQGIVAYLSQIRGTA